jgi:hypothetical protein
MVLVHVLGRIKGAHVDAASSERYTIPLESMRYKTRSLSLSTIRSLIALVEGEAIVSHVVP